ncbi:protein kinase subdomain-containing protein PKL/CAK/Fmp29 [Coprinopsis cinerea okayama7|uniref:Protein kinase subdomain-containing protein PKL/CAK/Fmp29 n=1 Tax=Coprinopsis cinerea (strain Okayama-7 / 130 / ATCC MYA-4618 / FGSC 9003) TaxID=240176 RepID=D6RPW2_COPC7|nr:protein kinase subdomain-containing protein PKL/CAK/Fmp29 [Coprinopsis cinerea okayama7\|eukprot:XP_002910355.1 protein kinase subdomain-containing protein PKL/CAK/Fmp29 [Coprinopsis cinerea okayama7\
MPTYSTSASNEDFFRFTSGRWLHDEDNQNALRYQRFNVEALKNAATLSLSDAPQAQVSNFSKLAEGRCNKVFDVQFTDGRRVLSLACPLPSLDLRTWERLGLVQVPRVLSWSSRAEHTPVEAEYVIMDVADGVELPFSVWHQLTMHQKLRLVDQWIKFESTVIKALSGGGYGSLYYRKDLPPEVARDVFVDGQAEEEFALGPSTVQLGYWEERFGWPRDLDLDCGPFLQLNVSSRARCLIPSQISLRLRACLDPQIRHAPLVRQAHIQGTMGAPSAPPDPLEPHPPARPVRRHRPYLIPKDKSFHRPVLTLRYSHQNNIFLSREALERDGTIQISAVIDWQHTAVLPLYLTTFIPQFIQLAIPAPGQPQEQFTKEIAYLRKAYHALYYETGGDVDWATIVMSEIDGSFPLSQTVPAGAERCWHRGYANLKKRLIDIGTRWVQLIGPGVPFPRPELCSDPEEAVRAEEDDVKWTEVAGELDAIQRFVGVGSAWGVSNEDYEGAVAANRELCKAWVESLTEEDKRGMGGVDPVDIWPVRP